MKKVNNCQNDKSKITNYVFSGENKKQALVMVLHAKLGRTTERIYFEENKQQTKYWRIYLEVRR